MFDIEAPEPLVCHGVSRASSTLSAGAAWTSILRARSGYMAFTAVLLGLAYVGFSIPNSTAQSQSQAPRPQQSRPQQLVTPTPSVEDGEWRMPGKDHASTRYSKLGEINRNNVRKLGV